MKVFVTGATGAIGGHVVPALVGAGHQVTALARAPEEAAVLEAHGATPVAVSLFDAAALTRAFAGHDAVANLASAIPPPSQFMRASAWLPNERVRREGSAAVAAAVQAAGVHRLVQESITFVYPSSGTQWLDEDFPVDPFPLAEGNLAAEAHARLLLGLARRHVAFVAGAPADYLSSIHLADAATAVVGALDCPAGLYNVVDDDPVTRRDYAAALGAAVGRRPWLSVPGRVARFSGAQAESLIRSQRVRNLRFRAATTWTPHFASVRDGLRAC